MSLVTSARIRRPILAGLVVVATATGCYKASFRTGQPGGGATHSKKVSHFLWGAAGGGEVDANAVCPDGVAGISEQKSFVDLLLSGLTGYLYSPTSVEIECAGGRTATR
jgi:hypothetical protein